MTLERIGNLRVVHLVKVNEIRFTRKDVAEPHSNRRLGVKELGTLVHGHTIDVSVVLDARDEHVHLHTVTGERGGARFDMRPDAPVASPTRCHK